MVCRIDLAHTHKPPCLLSSPSPCLLFDHKIFHDLRLTHHHLLIASPLTCGAGYTCSNGPSLIPSHLGCCNAVNCAPSSGAHTCITAESGSIDCTGSLSTACIAQYTSLLFWYGPKRFPQTLHVSLPVTSPKTMPHTEKEKKKQNPTMPEHPPISHLSLPTSLCTTPIYHPRLNSNSQSPAPTPPRQHA